jgi:hypothetical protein
VQLDNTRIAVRERGMIDTYDLTLHVIRNFASGLIPTLLLGIIPFAIINEIVLAWTWQPQEPIHLLSDPVLPIPLFDFFIKMFISVDRSRFGLLYLMLVYFEAPAATVFAEAYLGGAVFKQNKSLWDCVRDVFSLSHRASPAARKEIGPFWAFLFCQLLMRGTFLAIAIPLLNWGEEFNGWIEVAWPIPLFLFVSALRAFRPYINEIIVLEKNPLRSNSAPMTVGKRSSNLHGNAGAELFGQWLGSCAVSFALLQVVFWSLFMIYAVMFSDDNTMSWVSLRVLRPISLWIVVSFMGVARFLSYLDLRIRQEGWEVELLVRAEATRLAEKLV